MCAAVDAQAGSLEEGQGDTFSLLSSDTCARLCGVHTPTLRSMACLRDMLGVQLQPRASFPRLQSLRLHLGSAAIDSPSGYEAIASASPWLTHLSLELPVTTTALPQEMAALLAACSKLDDLGIGVYELESIPVGSEGWSPYLSIVDISQLRSLLLIKSARLSNLVPLAALVNLQSLDISELRAVSDLAPLGALVNLQSLDIGGCWHVSDLAPLRAMAKLRSLGMNECSSVSGLAPLTALMKLQSLSLAMCETVSDLAPLTALVNLQSLDIACCYDVSDLAALASLTNLQSLDLQYCKSVSDLAPLGVLVNLQSLNISNCENVSELAPLRAMVNLRSLEVDCGYVSDDAPVKGAMSDLVCLGAMTKLEILDISYCLKVSDLAPLTSLVNLQSLDTSGCDGVSDLTPLGTMSSLRSLDMSNCHAVTDLSPLSGVQLEGLRLRGQTIDASSLCSVISAGSPQLRIYAKDCVFVYAALS
ncbi:hypothetical protein FOA52_003489 [Chlamydomonas sp. UWO 241]|nr:hypothetical protein FOA52_003489 [Chlamydomonas sp. UWO 241]